MKYIIPFQLRNRTNNVIVEYNKMKNAEESGFEALNVPFDVDMCVGYPMIHPDMRINLNVAILLLSQECPV